MKYALTGKMAAEVDKYTINQMGVPSIVLMERAAVSVAQKVAEIAAIFYKKPRICAICGCGNNGADGIAAARILFWQGYDVDIAEAGNESGKTPEYIIQENIAKNAGMNFVNIQGITEYDIVIDGILGIGLKRPVEGTLADVINSINISECKVVSIDIPSGIDSATGQILGTAIEADITVTFGYNKVGLMLFPGKDYAGRVEIADIGFAPEAVNNILTPVYFTGEDIENVPKRIANSHKGTYGRILVIAGSRKMSGAAYLSAAAAYRSGAGLVEIFTHEDNSAVLKTLLPEAIVKGYNEENVLELLDEALEAADIIVLGPGLSTDVTAKKITQIVLDNGKVPLIIDADALNIISLDTSVLKNYNSDTIITPHIKELSRLSGLSKEELLKDSISFARAFAKEHKVTLVMKNAVTLVVNPEGTCYINTSGTGAMSKAGLGDVLTGFIAGMLALGLDAFSASAFGVYIHGLSGECAAKRKGEHSLLASDLFDEIGNVINL